jgi:RHS repeat-associated protein
MQQVATPQHYSFSPPAFELTQRSYYRARYYDPNAGRFLSEDPLGSGGGSTSTPMRGITRPI